MANPYRVIFVCMGNICRSPAAHIVLDSLIEAQGLDDQIIVDSAGTIGFHAGKGPDPRMSETLKARGYTIHGEAQKCSVKHLAANDLVLAMDEENLFDLKQLSQDPLLKGKIRLFTDFCEMTKARGVPDPYYGGQDGFETVADMVEDGCSHILDFIREELSK